MPIGERGRYWLASITHLSHSVSIRPIALPISTTPFVARPALGAVLAVIAVPPVYSIGTTYMSQIASVVREKSHWKLKINPLRLRVTITGRRSDALSFSESIEIEIEIWLCVSS
jgi:hypothetical protein